MVRDGDIEIPGRKFKIITLEKLNKEKLTRDSKIFENAKIKFVYSI
jgi:hypothetical protein